ncbi:MAG: hypothetical protein AABW88_03355 [Nanoarchaeota archaeon]
MSLIKILTIAGKIGLAGLVSGCAADQIKQAEIDSTVNVDAASEKIEQPKGKSDQEYSIGTFVVYGDCTGVMRTKEGLVQYDNKGRKEEAEDLLGKEPSYAIQEGINSGGTVYETGFPKNHPCYKPKAKKR